MSSDEGCVDYVVKHDGDLYGLSLAQLYLIFTYLFYTFIFVVV